MIARRTSSQGYTTFVPGLHDGDTLQSASVAEMGNNLGASIRSFLDPTEYAAVSLRYGLRDYESELESELLSASPSTEGKRGEALSFKEVGKAMEVSAEYARRVTSRALEKLRDNTDKLDFVF